MNYIFLPIVEGGEEEILEDEIPVKQLIHRHHVYYRDLPYEFDPIPRPKSAPVNFAPLPFELLHNCKPPANGSSLIDLLPDEVWLEILSHLEWPEIISIRSMCRRVNELALSPVLYQSVTFYELPMKPLPPVVRKRIIPSARYLTIYPRPSLEFDFDTVRFNDALLAFFEAVTDDQLVGLSIHNSAPYLPWHLIGPVLKRIGGVLQYLSLPNSGISGNSWIDWMGHIGVKGHGLRYLNLSYNELTFLPNDMPWGRLEQLFLDSCLSLPAGQLALFLARLPPTLRFLDLSHVESASFNILFNTRVITDAEEPTALKEVKLIGVSRLTRTNLRHLVRHWDWMRRPSPSEPPYSSLPTGAEYTSSLLGPTITVCRPDSPVNGRSSSVPVYAIVSRAQESEASESMTSSLSMSPETSVEERSHPVAFAPSLPTYGIAIVHAAQIKVGNALGLSLS